MSEEKRYLSTCEPSMTGLYIHDHGPDSSYTRQGCRYEVKFAFEGEILFEDMSDARAAAAEYEKIIRGDDPEKARLHEALAAKNAAVEAWATVAIRYSHHRSTCDRIIAATDCSCGLQEAMQKAQEAAGAS